MGRGGADEPKAAIDAETAGPTVPRYVTLLVAVACAALAIYRVDEGSRVAWERQRGLGSTELVYFVSGDLGGTNFRISMHRVRSGRVLLLLCRAHTLMLCLANARAGHRERASARAAWHGTGRARVPP
jgi:hypothetical protein